MARTFHHNFFPSVRGLRHWEHIASTDFDFRYTIHGIDEGDVVFEALAWLDMIDARGLREKLAELSAERRAQGRYRIAEAAEAIFVENAEVPFRSFAELIVDDSMDACRLDSMQSEAHLFEQIRKKLVAAIEGAALKSYLPGTVIAFMSKQIENRPLTTVQARFHDLELYWDELNVWLAEYEPRVQFRFPKPQQDQPKPSQESDWKWLVRDAAFKICLERRAEGKPPFTKSKLAEETATWCRNHDVKTETGKYPSSEYLRKLLKDLKMP
jgi:hypothetical protein